MNGWSSRGWYDGADARFRRNSTTASGGWFPSTWRGGWRRAREPASGLGFVESRVAIAQVSRGRIIDAADLGRSSALLAALRGERNVRESR